MSTAYILMIEAVDIKKGESMGNVAIQMDKVTAIYGRGERQVRALDQVELTVQTGEIFGVLGPNGAGKTTLLACIEGLHRPVSGCIRVSGRDISQYPQKAKSTLGVQLQRTALLSFLTVAELIDVYAALYQVYLTRAKIDRLLERFDLGPQRGVLAHRLSIGQQQRLALAIAVAHEPSVVLLDEPTTALDPHARRALWETIRHLQREGRTILLTTHAMEEAEMLCDRVAILDRGHVVACDTVASLIGELKTAAVVKVRTTLSVQEVRQLPGVDEVRDTGASREMTTHEPFATIAALHEMTTCRGHTVRDLVLRQPNLEDVFIALTGRTLQA